MDRKRDKEGCEGAWDSPAMRLDVGLTYEPVGLKVTSLAMNHADKDFEASQFWPRNGHGHVRQKQRQRQLIHAHGKHRCWDVEGYGRALPGLRKNSKK